MVDLGADYCLAFILDESNGSTHCRDLAVKAGIETKTFRSTSMSAIARRRVNEDLILYGVQLIWRNFTGREGIYNAKGKRNFSIRIDEEQFNDLTARGWEPKRKEPREAGDEPLFHLPVTVMFREGEENIQRNPRIFFITESTNSRNQLNDVTAMLVDYATFDNVDVTLHPYNWGPIKGEYGVKAYLKTLYGTLHEDPLDQKYADYVDVNAPLAIDNIIDAYAEIDSGWIDEGQAELPRGSE